jgi:hypothetical protein
LFAVKPNSVKDQCVMVQASIDEQAGKITLSWLTDTNAYKYYIYKKNKSDSLFGQPIAEFSGKINFFTDNIKKGEKVEYMVEKDAWDYWAYGYIYAGFDVEPRHNKGRVLILCDDKLYPELQNNIDTLLLDLAGDGWISNIELAPRTEEFNKENVVKTKNIIENYYKKYSDLKSIILIGRIAVPYSGSFAVDGHSPEHDGAWPTDVFYSVMKGRWTDTIRNIKADTERNRNLPNDGKYDQLMIPADAEIELGRIDFFKLPTFKESETDLLKRYLTKNHQYRNAITKTTDSTIVTDFFGLDYKEGFATSGWSNFTAISGRELISEEQLRYAVRKKSYLFAYGCGAGSFNSISETAYIEEFATEPFNAAFAMLFGSFNGDWDSEDNVLRGALATQPMGLAIIWAGRPYWFLHHLALGYNIGYSARFSQNSKPDEYQQISPYARRFNHIALLGDPTLRLHYVEPINNVIAQLSEQNVKISWDKSKEENILGYYIYRAKSKFSNYEIINSIPVLDSIFIDINPNSGENYYMVKVAKNKNTASGSYINTSTGKFSNPIFYPHIDESEFVRIFPIPANDKIDLVFQNTKPVGNIKINIFDLSGNKINTYNFEIHNLNGRIYNFDLSDKSGNTLSQGVYFLQFETKDRRIINKIIKQ